MLRQHAVLSVVARHDHHGFEVGYQRTGGTIRVWKTIGARHMLLIDWLNRGSFLRARLS
jgi:hypothetical protein